MLPFQSFASRRILAPNLRSGAGTTRRAGYRWERPGGGLLQTSTFATSAEKRKWKREGMSQKERERLSLLNQTNSLNAKGTPEKAKDINPFLFLVVFPLAMTGLVIMLRDDLRQQLADMGRRLTTSTKQ